ncbi:MAG: hypothetical protein H8E73_10200 [Planctomycetes bacterium]|nr:hypothetical protein [Planctomycetota bacterium]
MVTRDGRQLARESKETCRIAKPDLAAEALAQSSLQSHDHRVKCPKCGGTNVLLFEKIRRGKAEMVTWPTGGQ